MVIYLLFLLIPPMLFSQEFTASVDQNTILLGESFTLHLTLKDAFPKGAPSLDEVRRLFHIQSEERLFNTTIINGKTSSSTTWNITLIPQGEGEFLIPSTSIETKEGLLTTKPITIAVRKGALENTPELRDLILTTEISNVNPYKNEPFVFKVKLVSKRNIADIKMGALEIENALVDTVGRPHIYQEIIDGEHVGVIEYESLITPLKAGPLKIPAIPITGAIPMKRKTYRGSFFNDDFDPFALMQGFDQLKPFTLVTEEANLSIEAPIPGMNPWLPAHSLTIEEIWNQETIREGEPFTWGFKIKALGIKASQLPSLYDIFLAKNPHFKIYADKPELEDIQEDKKLKSYRKEQYTLIPKESGTLTLPEITLKWWDTLHKEMKCERLPPRILQILPKENLLTSIEQKEDLQKLPDQPIKKAAEDNLVPYIVCAGMGLLLLISLLWGIYLHKKVKKFQKPQPNFSLKPQKTPLKPPLNKNAYSPFAKMEEKKKEKLPPLNPT